MKETGELIEEADRWVVAMKGWSVTQCLVDYAFSLVFWRHTDVAVEVRIESEFRYLAEGVELTLAATPDPMQVGPALRLLNQVVESCVADKDGTLRLAFEGGSRITVSPTPTLESWQLSGPGGLLLVGLGGGGLAVWKPQ